MARPSSLRLSWRRGYEAVLALPPNAAVNAAARSVAGRAFGRRPGVEVPTRGRQLGVAHRVLDAHQVDAAGDKQRAERVAEVVQAERAQAGGVARSLVAAAQRRAIQRSAKGVAEIPARELAERHSTRAALALDALGLVAVLDEALDEFGGRSGLSRAGDH